MKILRSFENRAAAFPGVHGTRPEKRSIEYSALFQSATVEVSCIVSTLTRNPNPRVSWTPEH